MLDLGTARGAITLDAGGFLSGVGIVKSGVEELGGVGESASRGFSSLNDQIDNVINSMGRMSGAVRVMDGLSKVMGTLAITGGVTLLAGGARAAWDQVRSVQNATTALRAYEKDASKVDAVLEGLLEYAQSDLGVLFSRQELFSAAQGLKLYGAETSNLVSYVEIMSRSVGLGLSNWDQLGTVIGRVGSTGRLVGNDFDYLTAAGFRLDEGLRNTNITWDQLFVALDAGIPADALDGIADNIDGLVIRIQSAVRGIGNAFLGVDPKTSKFMEGSLGERLVQGLRDAPGVIRSVSGAAQDLGNIIAGTIGFVDDFVAGYQALPGPVKSAVEWILKLVTAYGALRVASQALGMMSAITGIGGMIGNLRGLSTGFASAATGSTSFAGALGGLVTRISPVGLAVTGITLAIGAGLALWGRHRQEVDRNRAAYDALQSELTATEQIINELMLSGDVGTASLIRSMNTMVTGAFESMSATAEKEFLKFWEGLENPPEGQGQYIKDYLDTEIGGAFVDWAAENEKLGPELIQAILDGNTGIIERETNTITEAMREYYQGFDFPDDVQANVQKELKDLFELMSNPNVDAGKIWDDFNEAWARFMATKDTDQLIADLDAIEQGAIQSAGAMTELRANTEFLFEMAGLRFSGQGSLANDLETLDRVMGDIAGNSEIAGTMFDFLSSQISSGTIDISTMTHELDALGFALEHGIITQEEYDGAVQQIILGHAELAETTAMVDAIEGRFIDGVKAGNEALAARREVIADNLEALMEVSGYGDPLSQWNLAGNATDMSLLAMSTQQAASALESTFRVIVGNTNAFASQSDAVHQWAQGLTTAEEGLTKIDELLAANLISQTEYNAAMTAATQIGEANERIQQSVLAIQAKQAPLIAEQTASLADQIDKIAQLPAQQQLIALGWMDVTTAGRAMEFQTLAVAAATGQLGENGDVVFSNMIAGAAAVDPVLSALLQDMGLISVGADGTITVHLSGVDGALSEMDELMIMMVNFMDIMDNGKLDGTVTFEVLGLEDPRRELENIEDIVVDLDGSEVGIGVTVDTPSGNPDDPFPQAFYDNLKPLVVEIGADSAPAVQVLQDLVDNPPTLTIPVSISAGNVGQDAGSTAAGMASGLVDSGTLIKIDVDASGAIAALESLRGDLSSLNSETATPVVLADDSAFRTVISQVSAALAVVETWEATVDVLGDKSDYDTMVRQISASLAVVESWEAIVSILGEKSKYSQIIGEVSASLGLVEGWEAEVSILAEKSGYSSIVNEVSASLGVVRGWSATVSILANASNVYGTMASLRMQFGGAVIATSYVNVVTRQLGGNIVGRATGGIVQENMTLVGEDGPELVSLPYGSEVYTNQQTMQMLRESRSNDYSTSSRSGSGGGTQYIDRSTHHTEFVALDDAQFAELLQAKERTNKMYKSTRDANALAGWEG